MAHRDGVSARISETQTQHPLSEPLPGLLASMLESRRSLDNRGYVQGSLPAGVTRDLRPSLPRIDLMALRLFTQRKTVQSFPLFYTMLAVAQPN